MADDLETARIRALREQIEATLNIVPRNLRANTRPDNTFPVEPILSSTEVDFAMMMYAPMPISDVLEREYIVIKDSDDEIEVVEKAEVLEISDDDESEPEGRGWKRMKLDLGVEKKDMSMFGDGIGEEGDEIVDEGIGMTSAELEENAEKVAFILKYGDSDDNDEDDSSDSSSSEDDSSDEDSKGEDSRNEIDGQLPGMGNPGPFSEGEERVKDEERETLHKPVVEKASRVSKKSMDHLAKKSGRKKRLTMLNVSDKLANPAKSRFLMMEKERMTEKKTISVMEKVAGRQRKPDSGEQLSEVLDVFPGIASSENKVQARSGGGQFGDDFVSFGDTKEKPQEKTRKKKKEKRAPVVEVKEDPFSGADYIGFGDLETENSSQVTRDQDDTAVKIEDGIRPRKRGRQA